MVVIPLAKTQIQLCLVVVIIITKGMGKIFKKNGLVGLLVHSISVT